MTNQEKTIAATLLIKQASIGDLLLGGLDVGIGAGAGAGINAGMAMLHAYLKNKQWQHEHPIAAKMAPEPYRADLERALRGGAMVGGGAGMARAFGRTSKGWEKREKEEDEEEEDTRSGAL